MQSNKQTISIKAILSWDHAIVFFIINEMKCWWKTKCCHEIEGEDGAKAVQNFQNRIGSPSQWQPFLTNVLSTPAEEMAYCLPVGNHCLIQSWHIIDQMWPGDGMWYHGSESTMDQVMVWCHQASSHCLIKCCLIIHRNTSQHNSSINDLAINQMNYIPKNNISKPISKFPGINKLILCPWPREPVLSTSICHPIDWYNLPPKRASDWNLWWRLGGWHLMEGYTTNSILMGPLVLKGNRITSQNKLGRSS